MDHLRPLPRRKPDVRSTDRRPPHRTPHHAQKQVPRRGPRPVPHLRARHPRPETPLRRSRPLRPGPLAGRPTRHPQQTLRQYPGPRQHRVASAPCTTPAASCTTWLTRPKKANADSSSGALSTCPRTLHRHKTVPRPTPPGGRGRGWVRSARLNQQPDLSPSTRRICLLPLLPLLPLPPDPNAPLPFAHPSLPCPLLAECKGQAKSRPQSSAGHLSIEDAITMKGRVAPETWDTEMLCLRPKRTDAVFPTFSRAFTSSAACSPSAPTSGSRAWTSASAAPTVVLWAAARR